MRYWITYLFLACMVFSLPAQEGDSLQLGFREYLAYVKQFHPVAKQANLVIGAAEANLLQSRGGFDPKLEVDYDRKEFTGTEYYDRLNAAFKIPTWFGIELKGQFEQNEGEFLNPDEIVPEDGLFSAGVSVSVARNLWINERMATLKRAKLFARQSEAERDLLVNQILFDAAAAYFNWLQAYRDQQVFAQFLENARTRFEGIRESALAGDIAAIDTVEAGIAVQNRALSLEQARVRLRNTSLELSNFLWLEDNVPVELQEEVRPELLPSVAVDQTLEIAGKSLDSFALEVHPKLLSLDYKIQGLEVDKNLKVNQLLPQIDLEYNFLTETPELINSFQTDQYKGGITFRMPLFLRKERGALKLAKFKLRDAEFERDNAMVSILNKVRAIYNELDSFGRQNELIDGIVVDYDRLLSAEERKFSFGESSLFLINSRERSLIDARLKANEVQNKYLMAKAKLFRALAINPEIIP